MNVIIKMTLAGETFPGAKIQRMKSGFYFTFLPPDGQTVLPILLRARHRKEAIEAGKHIVHGLEKIINETPFDELWQSKEQCDAWLKTFVSRQ